MASLWISLLLAMVCSCHLGAQAVDLSLFYPFNTEVGDRAMKPGDDTSTDEIRLDDDIVFYNKSYNGIYVNTNGHVSFGTEIPPYRTDRAIPWDYPIIGVFIADIDTRAAGRIYYRSTTDEAIRERAAADVQTYFAGYENFRPTSVFIVTWDRVGYYDGQSDELNTFQLVLATDGSSSFAMFHYLSGGINWMVSQSKYEAPYDDIPAQAGFVRDSDMFYRLPGSGDTATFVTGSNVNVQGVWMYQIGNLGRGNVRPADLNTGEVTLFDPETATDRCFQGASTCHANAQCIEHTDGFCCQCVPPFYGNGLSCLEPGVPQKINGEISGNINGIPLNLHLHTYVVTTDGRAYTAVAKLPPSLIPAMQTVSSIGGVIVWMFAVPNHPNAKNGYKFTGGRFNRTARVTFQSSDRADYVLRIYQEFQGHSALNEINMKCRLEGILPDFPEGATLSVDDYSENYKRTAPGVIKSFVARTYRVNGVAYKYTWDNTISFEECDGGEPLGANDVMKVTFYRNFVSHSEKVVRWAMSSKVGIFLGDDPCANAAQNCHDKSDCVPNGDSYRCVCQDGYTGNGQTCTDINECDLNQCDSNARCLNVPGSFVCRCNNGYTGDGINCRLEVQLCGAEVCDNNARCVFTEDQGQPRCECDVGFRGNGVRCEAIEAKCDKADICGDNAQCVYDHDLRDYFCECMDEFSGDGYSCEPMSNGCGDCDRNAQCVHDVARGIYTCSCGPGFTGDGRRCTVIDTCTDCDRHARCNFNGEVGEYVCTCIRGYQGDGRTCELRDCREEPSLCDPQGGLCWFDSNRNISICRCNYGYRGDGFDCRPINCEEHNVCDSNANCVKEGDTTSCQCNDGYEGDGVRCRPVSAGCNVLNDCDRNARCVPNPDDPRQYVCQCNPGYQGDGKVCRRREVPCNQVNNCDRNADCVYNPDLMSYGCVCERGYEGDGLSCRKREIIDCRRQPQMCSRDAECVQGSEDAFVCVCRPGFRGDGSSCSPVVQEGNYLIYAQGAKLMRVSSELRAGDYGQQIIYLPEQLAVGVDTDCENGELYWTDAAKGVIRKSSLNGSNIQEVVTGLKSPEGIAIDFIAKNMFFTDSEMDSLQVARLDGSSIKTLVDTDMVNPRAIVLDINRGVVYWTDWNRNRPQIERMNMDGSDRQVLVTVDLKLPNGLAFDTFSQTLCWGDAGMMSIECIRSDGAGRRVVFDKALYPFDLALLNNNIYWSDWKKQEIPSVSQSGGQENTPIKQAIGGHGRVYGITAIRDQCPRVRNSCGLNNGGCNYLCLALPNGGRTCSCPDGVDPRICN